MGFDRCDGAPDAPPPLRSAEIIVFRDAREELLATVVPGGHESLRADGVHPIAAFEIRQRIARGREVVIQNTGGDEPGAGSDQRDDVVDSATEIERGLGCPIEEATATSFEIQFEEVVRHAEAEEQKISLAVGEAETAGNRVEALLDTARRRGGDLLHGFGETHHGRANAIADLAKRAVPEFLEEVDGGVSEIDLKRSAPDDIAVGLDRRFERVAVPGEPVGGDLAGKRGEVGLHVAAGRDDADGAEERSSAIHRIGTVAEEVAEEPEGVERLELVDGVDGGEGGQGSCLAHGCCPCVVLANYPNSPSAILVPTRKRGRKRVSAPVAGQILCDQSDAARFSVQDCRRIANYPCSVTCSAKP